MNPLERLSDFASDLAVTEIANVVLKDPRFPIWSGSHMSTMHHYGDGGLCRHACEVVELCLQNNKFFESKKIDDRQVYLAALYHDCGKMWDYEKKDDIWIKTLHKRRIHHISRSGLVWNGAVSRIYGRQLDWSDDVLHAILAHHGRREWGSPVAPNTHLAWLLHLCDGLSARMDDCDKMDRIT